MKSPMSFLQYVLIDLGTWCRVSTTLDYKMIQGRVEHEGLSFLTITLAEFGKDFQKSLDQGFVGHDQYPGFKRTGRLPRFLGGFFDHVFDRKTGKLLHDPSITDIWAIRQLTLMFAKINLPCTDARTAAAIGRYVECEQEVRAADARQDPDRVRRFRRLSAVLWGDVLSVVDKLVYDGDIIPGHGPGATADRLKANAKWQQAEWTERLEHVFPHGEHLVSSWRYFPDLANVRVLEPGSERPVRVITVPKTLKTPRIIAVEPTCMQYMQQGLLDAFGKAVEADDIASGLIGWTSQMPNQRLACQGSRDGTLATLDLREASDRVSNQHVRILLANHRNLTEAVDATRSRKADVPGHGVIRLAKFASMGSALCFPMESMVFATMIFVGIEEELNYQLSRKDVKSFLGKVRVYGDDIIVPVEFASAVIEVLQDFGLEVNSGKSFWTGKFRESCGKDYFDGEDVSIVRIRQDLPTHRKDVPEIIATVSLRNQMYLAGMWRTTAYLDNVLERLIPFPVVESTSPLLGRLSHLGYQAERTHPDLFVPLVKGMMVKNISPPSRLDGYGALLKCLSKRSDLPFADARHLERSGRSLSVDIKQRWSTPY